MGKIDWMDEISLVAFVLNVFLPLEILLMGIHAFVRSKNRDARWLRLIFEASAVFGSAFVAISVWIMMDRFHGPEINLWAHSIWWR